jgi:hypothetical protein
MRIRVMAGVVAVTLTLVAPLRYSFGQSGASTPDVPSGLLKTFLRSYLSLGGKVPPDTTTRITTYSVKTDGGKTEENIVYVSGQGWCGSGGCTLLILEPSASSFKVLGKVTVVQLPVFLMPSMTHGHPDIGVSVRGIRVGSAYEAELSYDGISYPGNPSSPPSRPLKGIRGEVIIANTNNSVPLYD